MINARKNFIKMASVTIQRPFLEFQFKSATVFPILVTIYKKYRTFLFPYVICGKERIHEFPLIEHFKVIHSFPYTDEFHRNPELVHDSDDYSPFGRAVQLGDGKRRHIRRPGKLLCLLERILSGGTVKD